jgi:hypothetical protein
MIKTKAKAVTQQKVITQKSNEVIQLPKQNTGLIKVKVVKPVDGFNIGDVFETSEQAVRFQLKHKSIVRIE